MIKKLLISYSSDDLSVAQTLRRELLNAGYDVWIATEDLKVAVIWTQSILDAIESSEGIVLVWSSNAARSNQVLEEIRIARVFHKPIFPVFAHVKGPIPALPFEIQYLQVISGSNFNSTIRDLIERLSDPERNVIEYRDTSENLYLPMPPDPYFVGRRSELKSLFVDTRGFHGQTKQNIPIALCGMAGIGKTQLALTFAYRFNYFFSGGVFWIDTPNGIVQEFEKIGNHLKVKRHRDERPSEYALRIKSHFNQLNEGLLIFDNVTDFAEFRRWCPEGSRSCSVILTTRKSPRGFAVRVKNLTELDIASAYELIISRRTDKNEINADGAQRQALRNICYTLGNHPLALEFCANYLQSNFVKPTELLSELRRRDNFNSLMTDEKSHNFFGNVNLFEMLDLTYEGLNRNEVDPYFLLMCWFPSDGINVDVVVNAYGNRTEGLDALDKLHQISLVYRVAQNTIALHPLVVQFGRFLQAADSSKWQSEFIRVVVEYVREQLELTVPVQAQAETYLVEATVLCIEHKNSLNIDSKLTNELVKLLTQLADRKSNTGEKENAIRYLELVSNLSTVLKDEGLQRKASRNKAKSEGKAMPLKLKVFISYKWEDEAHNEWVKKLATDLRKAGIEALLDIWEVRLGESFTDYMTSNISKADVILFIMTTKSVSAVEAPKGEGGAIKFEMQLANARRMAGEHVRLIPVYKEGTKTAMHVRDHRYADFRDENKYEENLRNLINDLLGKVKAPIIG